MTWSDEIVEEVRRVREEHAAKFDYDISAICADIRNKQSKSNRKIVRVLKKLKENENGEIRKVA